MIATDLSKQQALDADLKAIQQINFTGNLDRPEGATIIFIIEEVKEIILDFSQDYRLHSLHGMFCGHHLFIPG